MNDYIAHNELNAQKAAQEDYRWIKKFGGLKSLLNQGQKTIENLEDTFRNSLQPLHNDSVKSLKIKNAKDLTVSLSKLCAILDN